MSWKKKFPNLYSRLLKNLKTSESALDKRVRRLAHGTGLAPDEALFVLARKEDVKYQTDFRKLDSSQKARVSSAISEVQTHVASTPIVGSKRVNNSQSIVVKTPIGSINEPLLSKTILVEAKTMSEGAYTYLYIFENSVRNFINLVMSDEIGNNWWQTENNTNKLKDIASKAESRMEGEKRYSYHGKRGAHPIYYTDFDDLIKIMRAKEKIFAPLFTNLPGKLAGLLTKLEEIQPSRNVSSHHNPLGQGDLTRLNTYLMDWVSQLKYLKSRNKL